MRSRARSAHDSPLGRPHDSPLGRHGAALAVVVAVVTIVVGCTAPPTTSPGPDAGGDLGAYLQQDVAWGGCDDVASRAADPELFVDPALECAMVEVPIDYKDPDGARGRIALTRLPATGQSEGSLLIDPGGPGGTGTTFVASTLPLWRTSPLSRRFDIVGFDPRGIGSSTPAVDCYSDAEYDAGTVPRFGAVYEITSAEAAKELADRCIAASGGVENLISVGSVDVVQDVDILRAVLGDEELTYLGYSYGSELGAMYATTFPDRVRAIVLDGAVAPDLTAGAFRASSFAGLQARFDDLAADCTASPDCVLGSDATRADDRLRSIVRPLIDAPMVVDGRELSVWDVYLGISAGLYAETKWPQIVSALTALEAGDGRQMLALRDTFYGRTSAGAYGTDLDTNIAVRCMDSPRLSPEQQQQLVAEIADVAPMFDLEAFTAGSYHSECEAWPAGPTRTEPWLTAPDGLPPTLVVSVTGDPATPHEGGIEMARVLGGHLLTVEGKQHGAFLVGGSDCVDDAVEAYLLDLDLPAADVRCRL